MEEDFVAVECSDDVVVATYGGLDIEEIVFAAMMDLEHHFLYLNDVYDDVLQQERPMTWEGAVEDLVAAVDATLIVDLVGIAGAVKIELVFA